MAKWYEHWFDRSEYEIVYRHRDDEDASQLLDLIERTVQPAPGARILDVGCGRGRHAIQLAGRGYELAGIDLSSQSIADAKERARELQISVHFEVRDMRDPFCDACVDGVVNLFTAFGYFDDDAEHLKAVEAIAHALKPGGWFVQDFLNAPYVVASLVEIDEHEHDGVHVIQKRRVEDGRIKKEIVLEENSHRKVFHESVQLIELEQFQSMYKRAGLEMITVFGTYDGAEYSETSPRLILFSRRA